MPDAIVNTSDALARNLVRVARYDGRVHAQVGEAQARGDTLASALFALAGEMRARGHECSEGPVPDPEACSVPLGVVIRRALRFPDAPNSWEARIVTPVGLWERAYSALSPWRALANLAIELTERGMAIDVPEASG